MYFNRLIKLDKLNSSAFLFGPRMTGKTTLLRQIQVNDYIDLLDPEIELQYKSRPALFWEQMAALPKGSLVIVDEIQRVPALLNYVQMGIDRQAHIYLMSGSSSRKLKRGSANLLGGRALDLKLHPLLSEEIGKNFLISDALQFGTLPKISDLVVEKKTDEAAGHLKSYYTTYVKEEIQAEALTRNIGSFQRFLNIAVQSNGQVIEFANIARDSSVPASTVKEYYQILEDTLIGFLLWPHDRSERKKARPKFYFFDCGVIRAIQNRLWDPPTPLEQGFLFETWFINELSRIRDYQNKPHEFSFWRERNHEIDFIVSKNGKPVLAIECKSGNANPDMATEKRFFDLFSGVPLIVASLVDKKPRKVRNIDILPWQEALQYYKNL
ncbi:MAG: ATP-binding protein [Desulfobacteraceae bacterium]|nr:MAG: ATP-binding protein [Desulfobacteraceae bacterium]